MEVLNLSSFRAPPLLTELSSSNLRKSASFSLSNQAFLVSSLSQLKCGPISSVQCSCIKETRHLAKASEGFSVLESDIPWDSGSIWSTFALYLFSFHVPLSFGGLSVVAHFLHQPNLDPLTEALSLVVSQMLELSTVFWLLNCVVKPQYEPFSFFQAKNQSKSKDRNWLLASALGLGFLILLVFLTSFVADQLAETKEANGRVLKEILSSGTVSQTCCILAYCVFTPLLEETIYRGILLTSLTSQIKWHQAVVISSVVFSAAHFSGANFLQLFIVGSVLGCSYCWTVRNSKH